MTKQSYGPRDIHEHFTQDQEDQLVEVLDQLRDLRDGIAIIVFTRGHPRFYGMAGTEEFLPPDNNDPLGYNRSNRR